ncbi:MAG: tRNA preQ1(34) S-adenosylmethionine ribosyltransferase-isomerase QueA [Anaeromusa sp.]|jgi:S-adenosylmethionine:tRNA ribosyltransferase-isomerase|uniref:tRNA preQ1(34) S-adenosylmethionine ribosyltransferase-isomerase QueA n=1 Tax=Anaeromusa sp. TaxID=1872520 RepID=UPI002B204482|nr:tRNA preQ1(34) S-adenosylmethionine ribosyltransferase-isomerase QueA [Anaeromusa sp.]MEA4834838.1 tRNA preQ1(34) S-adenosylmethionine ribosyltransferase-isomerase QueA [Anaeromusa sp.]
MNVQDFDYYLPEELIAQTPLAQRDASRLMVLPRQQGACSHRHFFELPSLLRKGDLLVFNDTRVIPARLHGRKRDTGAKVEVFLLKRLDLDRWETLVRPGRKLRPGTEVVFSDELSAVIEDTTEFGGRIVRFCWQGVFEEILQRLGEVPLPPYIHEKLPDPERYQTVYARENGSAAAPTAGLHFTPELLSQLREQGIQTAYVTLHVGLGTFRPVAVESIQDHVMHSEQYAISAETAALVNETRRQGGRVIAVGTTAVRTLETAGQSGQLQPCSGFTNIFIYPGYEYKIIDGLITNFHLPKSTLLMLVSALAGRERVLAAYKEAVEQRYRFFSFGDAMFIL